MPLRQRASRITRIRALSVIGFAGYIASFFLPAARAGIIEVRGWEAAWVTLAAPFNPGPQVRLGEYLACLVSGWINPLFVVSLALLMRNPDGRLGAVLRLVLLVMFGACWVLFREEKVVPAPGYYLWTASMLLALFAGKLFPSQAGGSNLLNTHS